MPISKTQNTIEITLRIEIERPSFALRYHQATLEIMMAEIDPKRVRSIFLAAVEGHAPDQWDDYLARACEGEPDLRRRVEGLLQGHRLSNDLLDDPVVAPLARPTIGEGPGTVIGSYKLLEQIGEGGFGVVFMAEQSQPVRRKVAIKIVKPGMETRQVVARFEAERQALAMMDHPNIAQIYDGGATESGRPFFVMELVRGIPITLYCDQHQLGVRERLELFTHVCHAVHHAHQKGIIHRDLKPSNVIVTQHDVTPVVKIIDFGIAKATGQQLTDRTLFTNYAQMIGTPMYMSPEQARMSGLDVDTRSDIYSLGVLLYELMTGTTPFERERLRTAAYDEMIRIIREEEPVRPSTRISTLGRAPNATPFDRYSTPQKLCQLLRGELDWIVMKALEKDRNRRYESASALANEVQRYLQDEPVLACPPTLGYRLRKTARRHKAALATAALVFVALSTGTAVAVWQAVVATRAQQVALESAAAEKSAKTVAQAKEAEAQAVIAFLEDHVIAAVRPEGNEGGLGYDVSLRRALEAALPFVQQGFKDQPLIEARLRMSLGHSYASLGEPKKSGEQYELARKIYIRHLGSDDEATVLSVMALVASYSQDRRYVDAIRLCETTLLQLRATIGADHATTLRAEELLAVAYAGIGRRDDALAIREKAVAIRKATLGPEHPQTVHSLHDLAASYMAHGRHGEALVILENVLAVRKANTRIGADHPDTLHTMINLAWCYHIVGQHDDAFKLGEKTLTQCKAVLGVDHPLTLRSMNNLAAYHSDFDRHAEALALHQQTLALRIARLGADHSETHDSLANVACNLVRLNRSAEAVLLIDGCLQGKSHVQFRAGLLSDLLGLRMHHFLKNGDVAGCRATAAMWDGLDPIDNRSLYYAARAHATVAAMIRDGDASAESGRQSKIEADLAMDWLRKAVAAGSKYTLNITRESDFDILRQRADYIQLLAEMAAATKVDGQ